MYSNLGLAAVIFMVFSLSAFGTLIVWKAPLPRWSGFIGTISGLTLLVSLCVALAVSADDAWIFLLLSTFLGLIWLVVTGAWLVARGMYVAAPDMPHQGPAVG
jgi:hypothetical protein